VDLIEVGMTNLDTSSIVEGHYEDSLWLTTGKMAVLIKLCPVPYQYFEFIVVCASGRKGRRMGAAGPNSNHQLEN